MVVLCGGGGAGGGGGGDGGGGGGHGLVDAPHTAPSMLFFPSAPWGRARLTLVVSSG